MFYRTFINGLAFIGNYKEAIEVAIDTLEKSVILGEDVYGNLLRNLSKSLTSYAFNHADELTKQADVLKKKLVEMNVNINGKAIKRNSNGNNNNYRRRKSEDPLPYHKSIEGKQSHPQVTGYQKKRNSSGFDGNHEMNRQNIIKASVFGSNK